MQFWYKTVIERLITRISKDLTITINRYQGLNKIYIERNIDGNYQVKTTKRVNDRKWVGS